MKRAFLVLAVLIIFPLRLSATETSNEENDGKVQIDSSVGLSYVTASGNSVSQTLSIEADANIKSDHSELGLKAGIIYGETDSETTSEYWYVESQYNRDVTTKAYLFALTGLEGNKLSGYRTRITLQPGIGYKFLEGRHELKGEVSPGYVHEDRIDNKNLSYASYLAHLAYKFKITDKAVFLQDAEYIGAFSDGDNYRVNTDTSFTISVTDFVSFKTGMKVQYVNLPPDETKRTDTFTATSLVFTF